MTEILLIRHAETAWNAERRLQGHLDIGLNKAGERQADALGQALSATPLEAIYASDLGRALSTAQAVAMRRGMQVETLVDLRERCFGAFEGMTHDEIKARYPDGYVAWQSREVDARFPMGVNRAETLREFSARAVECVSTLARKHAGRIAVVTHGGVLDCIYRAANGIDFSRPRDFAVLNASVNRIGWDGVALEVLQWADVAHLQAAARDEIDAVK